MWPNPLNGITVDGFVADDKYLIHLAACKIPIRHGMTMGELAKLYVGEGFIRGGGSPKLHVIDMVGWKRNMWFDDTGLPWKKPSPNLLTLQSVIAYGGTCLFEGLNVSEGRGTDHPFEYIGAPWMDSRRVLELVSKLKLRGVKFEEVTFVPEKKPYLGRPPELNGEKCNGIYINVTNRDKFELYKAGVALVWAIHKVHADKLVWNDKVIERLTGTDRLLAMVRGGDSAHKIFNSWKDEVAAFKERRKLYLSY